MIKYKLATNNKILEFVSLTQAQNYALANNLSVDSIIQEVVSADNPQDTLEQAINDKIAYFQSIAPQLVRELYVANTIAGITTVQSDQMFDDYADVLLRIKEGAFPTALFRLDQKAPEGFVTQELIDTWKAKILGYLQ
jgi:hypothetical protein